MLTIFSSNECTRSSLTHLRKETSYLMNLAIKELADTKFEVVLCCCLSILNLFPLTSTNIFLCGNFSCKVSQVEDSEFLFGEKTKIPSNIKPPLTYYFLFRFICLLFLELWLHSWQWQRTSKFFFSEDASSKHQQPNKCSPIHQSGR